MNTTLQQWVSLRYYTNQVIEALIANGYDDTIDDWLIGAIYYHLSEGHTVQQATQELLVAMLESYA